MPSHRVGAIAEVAADVGERVADRAAADVRPKLRQGGEVGRDRAVRPGRAVDRPGRGWRGGLLRRLRAGRLRRAVVRVAGLVEHQVAAPGGAGEQHLFQRHGAQQAAGEPGLDGGQARGAEELRDGGEAAPGCSAFEGVREVAAVAEQDADDDEEVGDVGGTGLAGRSCGGTGWGGRPAVWSASRMVRVYN